MTLLLFGCSACGRNALLVVVTHPFRWMGASRKTKESQKAGNSPGPEPEVIEKQKVAKESVAGQCKMKG